MANNFLDEYMSKRVLSRYAIFLIDLSIIVFSNLFIYLVHFGPETFLGKLRMDGILLSVILVFSNTISFFIFRTFSGILRFSSFSDLLRLVYALTLGYLVSYGIIHGVRLFYPSFFITNSMFLSIYAVNMIAMVFLRVVVKEIYDRLMGKRGELVNVFVYGTKTPGVSLAKGLKSNRELNYRLKGFISDEDYMIGKNLLGVKIYRSSDELFEVLREKEVETVIISPQKMEEVKDPDFLNDMLDHNILLLTTAPLGEWNGELTRKEQIKDIQIEDLLPRAPIRVNTQKLIDQIEGKRVLVTGAAGSIGSEIARQLARFNPHSMVLVDQAETPLHSIKLEFCEKWPNVKAEFVVADISNATRMRKVFEQSRPEYVFHAAAYKHVPMMEENVSESVQNNILGTKNIADLSVSCGVSKFVMVSTDKAVNPSNVMGCSKRICEIYVQSLGRYLEKTRKGTTQFITTRFGNVLGSNGSVIPLFREQIKNGGPVTVTHPEMIRYFMLIPEACQLVLEAGFMGNGGEIYMFDMGKPVKIMDLAKRMISLSGLKNIKIEFTGLRHGEKLSEELLAAAECTKPTYHEKIMIANIREYEYDEVKAKVDDLIEVSYEFDDMLTVKKMKEIVPEYLSINSPFEIMDKVVTNGSAKV